MKKVYFAIIELPEHQVLIKKNFGAENGEKDFLLDILFFHDGVKIKQSLGFDLEESRDRAFDMFSDNHAQGIIDDVYKMINDSQK